MNILKIDNSLDAAVKSGKWSNPGASFYNKLMDSIVDDRSDQNKDLNVENSGDYTQLLKEAYLIAPVKSIKNSPYGRTPFSRSGCKYPHHSIRDGKLVVNIPGLKAAYARARQSNDFRGDLKEHLIRHYKEMEIYEGSTMDSDQKITENFEMLIDHLCESNDSLRNAVEEDKKIEKELEYLNDPQSFEESNKNEKVESLQEYMNWIENFIYNENFRDNLNIIDNLDVSSESEMSAIFTEADKKSDEEQDSTEEKDKEESEKNDDNPDETNEDESSEDSEDIIEEPVAGSDKEDEDKESSESDQPEEALENIIEEPITPDSEPDTDSTEGDKISKPKEADKAEKGKNGVRRKKLYMLFIEWAKEYNSKNTFGSIFDKDAFRVTYPFVPEEMRYFYRLANPMMCTLAGNLTFFQASELKKANSENNEKDKYFIFAATLKDMRVFNLEDKKVYSATEKDGKIILGDCLGDSFDIYLQTMIKRGDILNGPID